MSQEKRTIIREASAGLDDKGDVQVRIIPGEKGSGIQLDIKSKVETMFGDQIEASVLEVLGDYHLTDLRLELNDKGALDYALRARLIAAIERAIRE